MVWKAPVFPLTLKLISHWEKHKMHFLAKLIFFLTPVKASKKEVMMLLGILWSLVSCIHSLELHRSSVYSASSPEKEAGLLPSLHLKKTMHKKIKVSSFFWGLAGGSASSTALNLWRWCSSEDYSLKISHSFPQWLALVFSFGIYIPYTLHLQCHTGA